MSNALVTAARQRFYNNGNSWGSKDGAEPPAGVFFSDGFNDGLSEWGTGSNVSIEAGGGISGSDCAIVEYNAPGTAAYTFRRDVSTENLNEGYVSFDFKVDPAINGGCKFLKLFGKQVTGYANFTLMLNYTSGELYEISYGNGVSEDNDTQSVIRMAGTHSDPDVNINTSSSAIVVADNTWRNYEFYFKYNTTGQRDGAFKVWVDGVLMLDADNVKNSHDNNTKEVEKIGLADYSQSNSQTWYLRYDNVVFSRSRIGETL